MSLFGHPIYPFSQAYTSFEWGQDYSTILMGSGVLLAGIGWALEQRARERRQGRLLGTFGASPTKFGVLMVLLGAATVATGLFLSATLGILGLEGVDFLATALGPEWSAAEYDILVGVGLLIAAAGVFLLRLVRRPASVEG
jgi:hypothetical protein